MQKKLYCIGCGKVKYQGSDRAKKVGYFTNILSNINELVLRERKRGIRRIRSITVIQKRLMVREMESSEVFTDPWVSTRKLQLRTFRRIIKRHCPNLSDNLIEAAIYRM